MPDETVNEAMQRLLNQTVIRGDLVEMLLRKAIVVAYWRNLNPDLVVSERQTLVGVETVGVLPDQQSQALEHLKAHGYFVLPPLYSPELMTRMRDCVDSVRNAGWPAVFAYVYDELWALFQSNVIAGFVHSYIGDYKVNAKIWTYYVEPKSWAGGWRPHVDGWNGAGRLTVWIPLTTASLDNGCMYVIPRDRVPETLLMNYQQWQGLDMVELGTLLHSVRPLPAKAGSILGWNHELIHWGGRASDSATEPRISIAVEFISETVPLMKSELPVFSPGMAPGFPTRLKLIAKAILEYKRFEPLMTRYGLLAQRLIDWSEQESI